MSGNRDQLNDILETVKRHLSIGESDRPDADGRLHHKGSSSSVADVLSKFETDVNSTNDDGDTLLTIASRNNDSAQVIRELITLGASVMTRDSKESTPLHSLLFNEEPNIEAVSLLLTYNADVNAKNQSLQTPLHLILQHKKPRPEVVELLLKHGADVTTETEVGNTPLLLYLQHHGQPDIEIIRLLLHYKSDVNAKDQRLLTPLHFVLLEYRWKCKPEVVELLLNYGADVNAEDLQNNTPLHHLLRNSETEDDSDIDFFDNLYEEEPGISNDEEQELPIDLSKNEEQERPSDLSYVEVQERLSDLFERMRFLAAEYPSLRCKEPDIETVRLLLHYKADVNAKNKLLETPLHLILEHIYTIPNTNVIVLLLSYGADVTARDFMNLTPIDKAIQRGKVIFAKIAIKYTLLDGDGNGHWTNDGDWTKIIDIGKSTDNRWYAEAVTFIDQCVSEIIKMKGHRVCEKFSLYDWFHFVKRNRAAKPLYTTEMISEDEIVKQYPEYGSSLWYVIKACLVRVDLLNQLEELQSTDVFSKLGTDCLREIVKYLPNKDLVNFISALSR